MTEALSDDEWFEGYAERMRQSLVADPLAPADDRDALATVAVYGQRYQQITTEASDVRMMLVGSVVRALRAGIEPTIVAGRARLSTARVRQIARKHGIPPAPPGPKTRRDDTMDARASDPHTGEG